MAAIRARISCINKTDRQAADERIRNVGGVNPDGGRWNLGQDQAVAGVEDNKYSFYVERPAGDVVNVVVAVSARGRKYLKTVADGDQPNNLLSLPECP